MFDSTGCSGQHAVTSASPRDRLNQEPVHGSAKQGVVVVRSPTQWSVPGARSSGRALFFFTARDAFCLACEARAIAAPSVILSRSSGEVPWRAVDVATRRHDKRTIYFSASAAFELFCTSKPPQSSPQPYSWP